ncbi:hypothetical protein [Fodinicola acaciae]|uniref:hypothetical protein n=1 Tax=Fodinicola acaciae TaxID=2681555 RepID=UPI0013D0B698|nr:hypothetical protein [Fodinicola acaciae]
MTKHDGSGTSSRTLRMELAAQLRRLRVEAGNPTLSEMVDLGAARSKQTLDDVLEGTAFPRRHLLESILTALKAKPEVRHDLLRLWAEAMTLVDRDRRRGAAWVSIVDNLVWSFRFGDALTQSLRVQATRREEITSGTRRYLATVAQADLSRWRQTFRGLRSGVSRAFDLSASSFVARRSRSPHELYARAEQIRVRGYAHQIYVDEVSAVDGGADVSN